MGIRYENLDDVTRRYMIKELKLDDTTGNIYFSTRFNQNGQRNWIPLLEEAILYYDDDWLATQLRSRGCFNELEPNKKTGGLKKVPYNAHETCAEGEFNRYYARGLCLRALSEGTSHVEVYRGKEVRQPRPESEDKIGQRYSVEILLRDLRSSQGVEPALGIPPGPNSGISVRLPR